jgi:hypothetical protein
MEKKTYSSKRGWWQTESWDVNCRINTDKIQARVLKLKYCRINTGNIQARVLEIEILPYQYRQYTGKSVGN